MKTPSVNQFLRASAYLWVLLFFLVGKGLLAQTTKTVEIDSELWIGAEASGKLFKNCKISIEEEIRFNEKIANHKSTLTNINLRYKIFDWLRIYGDYRFTLVPQDAKYRLDGGINFQHKIKPIHTKVDFRTRYQWEKEIGDQSVEKLIRPKLTLSYASKKIKWSPYILNEWFYLLDKEDGNRFNRYRIGLGTGYKLHKDHQLKIGYTYQERWTSKKIKVANIFRLGYSYGF